MVVWDPFQSRVGNPRATTRAKVILWKGHCSVHQRFLPEHVDKVRAAYPGIRVMVHPECRLGSLPEGRRHGLHRTDHQGGETGPAGTKFAIGTEIHLMNRLAKSTPDKMVITLDDSGCLCTTMYRISPQHLCWALENLVEGNIVNQIKVRRKMLSIGRGWRSIGCWRSSNYMANRTFTLKQAKEILPDPRKPVARDLERKQRPKRSTQKFQQVNRAS